MSDPKHQRFEIDLDEIERQLRQSVEATGDGPPRFPLERPAAAPAVPPSPSGRPDPLAELARIVGQDDAFRTVFGTPPQAAGRVEPVTDVAREAPQVASVAAASTHAEPDPMEEELFDPVANAYGAPENAIEEDFQPLAPRRSRRRLGAVVAGLALCVLGVGGVLAWRGGVSRFVSSGPPPLIRADTAPAKVAPDDPGGVDVPNQNKQIYERGTPDGKARIVDRQEQPLDVNEAARALPPRAGGDPVAAKPPATAGGPAPAPQVATAPPAPAPRNAVNSVLGEPRRVRTVSVRPDGSEFTGSSGVPADLGSVVPTSGLPPPVQVATVAIPAGGQSASPGPASAPPSTATPSVATTVLPPQRPRFEDRVATTTPAQSAARADAAADAQATAGSRQARPGARVAAAPQPGTEADDAAAAAAPSARPARGGYAVQIAVRPSEQGARSAYTQLADKYPTDLGGKAASVVKAEVDGKTLYRVRVGPMSREDANTLCTRLKSAGGSCFVAPN